jgi:ectoine hydroxylase-related dioxygenase (phytanoyl-CoA dioxygenase family)
VLIAFDEATFAPQQDVHNWRQNTDLVRRRFAEEGYVLIRGALDRDAVLDLRESYFSRFDSSLFADGTTPRDGIFSGVDPDGLAAYGTAGHPAYDLVRSAEFDAFSRTPELRSIAETILGGPAELLPRRILRHFQRSAQRASRAHVDFDYMNHGSDKVVTAWIPLGDCPIECGGLVYLERSHTIPRAELEQLRDHTDRPHDRRPISNDLGMTARVLGGRWLWANFQAGDVVLHSPHIVHASLDNMSDVMRLSADVRFRRRDAQPDERWNSDWSADDGF